MKLKSRSSGISLISLIITIIVIIILAAIVIFSGMGTPEKAQLSKVISDIDNVQTAVDQAYYGLYTEKAVAGEVWTKSQFYEAVATGNTNRNTLNGTGLIEIADSSLVKINLPKYEGRKWYIAVSDVNDTVKTGSAVLSPGFESDGKVYATLLDVQNGGGDGSGLNGGSAGELTEEDLEKLSQIQVGDFVNYLDEGTPAALSGNWRVLEIGEDGNIKLYLDSATIAREGRYYAWMFDEYLTATRYVTINISELEYVKDITFGGGDRPAYLVGSPYGIWQKIGSSSELNIPGSDNYSYMVNVPA